MAIPVRFTSEANEEVERTIEYYDGIYRGLGERFYRALMMIVNYVETHPNMFPYSFRYKARKAVIQKFPYLILYRVEPEEILIVAVFCTHQNPSTLDG